MTKKREQYIQEQIRKQNERKTLPNFYVRIVAMNVPKKLQKIYQRILPRAQAYRKAFGYLNFNQVTKDTVIEYKIQEI